MNAPPEKEKAAFLGAATDEATECRATHQPKQPRTQSAAMLRQIAILRTAMNAARETVFRFQAEIARLEDELQRRAI